MLTTASKDANMQSVMFASLRRGLFLENLVGTDGDATLLVQGLRLGPGASSGWHTHPGPEVSVITIGTVVLQTAAECVPVNYGAGQAVFIPAGPMTTGLPNDEKAKIRQLFAEGKVGCPSSSATSRAGPCPASATVELDVPKSMPQ